MSRFSGEKGSKSWGYRVRRWKKLLARDSFKNEAFKKFGNQDYYLIRIPTYIIDVKNRKDFIIKTLERITGLNLNELKL